MEAAVPHIDYQVLYEKQAVVIADLKHQLEQFKKLIFGARGERFVPIDDTKSSLQLKLGLDADTIAPCKITDATKITVVRTTTEVTGSKPKPHPGRVRLPGNLRRETIILQPATNVDGLKKIGEDITEILDFIPGELYVRQYIRPKYVRPLDEVPAP